MKLRMLAAAWVASFLVFGCGAASFDSDEEIASDSDPIAREDLHRVFKRVVLGRVYQHKQWTLPPADSDGDGQAELTRDFDYVCETYAKLNPSYVSGLVRYDADEVIAPETVDGFRAIRSCIRKAVDRPVRFDVVLNAEQYDKPDAIRARMKELDDLLQPDIFFFDFFQAGYRHHREAVGAAIDWAHAHHRLIGGNDWGGEMPPGSDFVAACDCDGMASVEKQVAALHARYPRLEVLLHLENNPGNDGNRGEKWLFDWGTDYRKEVLERQADKQSSVGYRLMYPVFFPLTARRDGKFAQFANYKGLIAYDARLDGSMLDKMKTLLDQHD